MRAICYIGAAVVKLPLWAYGIKKQTNEHLSR